MGWLLEQAVRVLAALRWRFPRKLPAHLVVAQRGEMEAYFYLRRLGYRVITTNFRVHEKKGEIDLIAWNKGVLCFVEVKTSTKEGFAPPEAAVDVAKKKHILSVARSYVRRLPGNRVPP
jgi:putative endonuclease